MIAEILHASGQGEQIDEILDEYKRIRRLAADGSKFLEIGQKKIQRPLVKEGGRCNLWRGKSHKALKCEEKEGHQRLLSLPA